MEDNNSSVLLKYLEKNIHSVSFNLFDKYLVRCEAITDTNKLYRVRKIKDYFFCTDLLTEKQLVELLSQLQQHVIARNKYLNFTEEHFKRRN